MARDIRGKSGQQPVLGQILLMKALSGLILAAATYLDPPALREMIHHIGAWLGRHAVSEYCQRRHAGRRRNGYTVAECLKEIGGQFGWSIRAAVESDGVVRVHVLECDVAESDTLGSYLCEFNSGLFGGAMAEAIGDVKVSMSECTETAPCGCTFAIYYRESAESQAAEGAVYPQLRSEPARHPVGSFDSDLDVRLTSREAQVLGFIAQGLPDKAIAATLQLSVRTVENHAARLRKKLCVGNRAALVRFALDHRLVDL